MENEALIPLDLLCSVHGIDVTFLHSLRERGLVEFTVVEEVHYLHPSVVEDLEKFIRLHTELDINLEGLEAVAHLLRIIHARDEEIRILRNRLEGLEEG
jgi:chaperone modulatory protein CbpM